MKLAHFYSNVEDRKKAEEYFIKALGIFKKLSPLKLNVFHEGFGDFGEHFRTTTPENGRNIPILRLFLRSSTRFGKRPKDH